MNPEEEELIPPKPSVKAPANFTSPDELYKELEDSVRKYHPSALRSNYISRAGT